MLKAALLKYRENIKAALAFAILLIFIPIFYILNNTTITSTNIFWNYIANSTETAISIIVAFAFFAVAATLHATLIFAAKKSLAEVREYSFIAELPTYASRIFLYYVLLSAIYFVLVLMLPMLVSIAIAIAIFLLLMFVPQSIVIEENTLSEAILNSIEFVRKKILIAIEITIVASLLIALAAIFEFALDIIFYSLNLELKGAIFAVIIVLLFIVPYIETLKSVAYMKKFELITFE